MKILHIAISCFYIEGAGYQENLLPREHRKLGAEVVMVSSQYAFDAEGKVYYRPSDTYMNADGMRVVILRDTPHLRLGLNFFKPKCHGLYKILEIEKPDIIFMHGLTALDSLWVVRYKEKNPAVQLYCDQHGDYYNTKYDNLFLQLVLRFIHRPLAQRIAKSSMMIWGTTPWRCDFLKDVYGVPAEKVAFLPMGCNVEKKNETQLQVIRENIRRKYDLPQDCFLICSGGKLTREKNILPLVQAVCGMDDKNVKLLLFGSIESELELEIRRTDKNCQVYQAGWLKSEEAYDIFMASELACFPGTHSVLWEQAVACGVPCIFRDWAGMRHVNVNGNAIMLEDVTESGIRIVIQQLTSNHTMYEAQLKCARSAQSEFFYEAIARKSIGL